MAAGHEEVVSGPGWRVNDDAPDYFRKMVSWIGVQETVKSGRTRINNPVVAGYFERVHNPGYEANTAWCAAVIGASLEDVGMRSTRALNARSYLKYCNRVELDDLQQGDIVVTWRGKTNDGVTGHVFYFVGWVNEEQTKMYGLGGNQRNRQTNVDEVSVAVFSVDKFLGASRPRSVYGSKTLKVAAAAATTSVVQLADNVHNTLANVVSSAPEAKTIEAAKSTVESLKPVVAKVTLFPPYVKIVFEITIVVLIVMVVWYRVRDYTSGKNT